MQSILADSSEFLKVFHNVSSNAISENTIEKKKKENNLKEKCFSEKTEKKDLFEKVFLLPKMVFWCSFYMLRQKKNLRIFVKKVFF